MKHLLSSTGYINETSINSGGWRDSYMRQNIMNSLYLKLPTDLQNCIKSVDKKSTDGDLSTNIISTSDKLWLFSDVEISGTVVSVYCDEGTQYSYWSTFKLGSESSNRIKYLSNGLGTSNAYWLRSVNILKSANFCSVSAEGLIGNMVADKSLGICFGFCI